MISGNGCTQLQGNVSNNKNSKRSTKSLINLKLTALFLPLTLPVTIPFDLDSIDFEQKNRMKFISFNSWFRFETFFSGHQIYIASLKTGAACQRLPLYIVAKAVSVLCDVCKQDSISWDNTGREGHIWAGWGVTQDMCDHLQSSFADTATQIFYLQKCFSTDFVSSG